MCGFTLRVQGKPLSNHLGSTSATMKLKGIDGGPHKRWSMWFNSMIREEPYLGSNGSGHLGKAGFLRDCETRCCMVVVSSCREVLG
jgi:hypothetical protein